MIRSVLSASTTQQSGKSVLIEAGEGTKAAQVLRFVACPHAHAISTLCNILKQSLQFFVYHQPPVKQTDLKQPIHDTFYGLQDLQ
jgi:hypothetical protein